MKTLHAVVLALLLGSSAAVSTGAAAATPSSALRATATEGGDVVVGSDARPQPAIGGYRLAQYGGGDDDDDDRPARSSPGGGYSNPGGGNRGGGVNAGDVMNIIRGVGSMIDNAGRQQQQNRDYQIQRQEQARRAAQEAERRRRQQQEAAKERARRQAEERNLQKERQRLQDERNRLQDEAKQNELDRQRRDAIQQQQNAIQQQNQYGPGGRTDPYQQQNPSNPNPPPQQAQQNYPDQRPDEPSKVPDKIDNTPITIIVEQHDVFPPPNEIPKIPVGRIEVPACGYVNLPADRRLCAGTTASGGWLRVVNVPVFGGGTRPVCVQYCRQPPVPPPNRIVTPVVPIPPPNTCAYPPCGPPSNNTPVVPPIPCSYPPCGPSAQVEPPTTDSTETIRAVTTIEPDRPTTDSTETIRAVTTIEPDRPTTDSTETIFAKLTIEPDRPETDSQQTAFATPTIIPNGGKPQRNGNRCTTPPCGPIADDDSQPDPPRDRDTCATPPCGRGPAQTAKLPDAETPDSSDFEFNRFVSHPRRDDPPSITPPSIPRPDAPVDTKVCATERPSALLNEPEFKKLLAGDPNLPEYKGKSAGKKVSEIAQKLVVLGAKEVEEVGSVLGPLLDAFFNSQKDDPNKQLFNQMKEYVDKLVPELIAQEKDSDMQNELEGLRHQLDQFHRHSNPEVKKIHLVAALDDLARIQPKYFDLSKNPERRLAHFAAFGALHLAALQEMEKNYKKYFPPDSAEADKKQHDEYIRDYNEYRDKYLTTINGYDVPDPNDRTKKIHVKGLKDRTLDWRLSKVGTGRPDCKHYMQGRKPRAVCQFYATDSLCDWKGADHQQDEKAAEKDKDRRKQYVAGEFGRNIDLVLEPITSLPALSTQAASVQTPPAPSKAEFDSIEPAASPKPSAASCSASADQCNSQCGFVMSPGPGGMMTMNADQACADRCSQQAAICRANADAPRRSLEQQLRDQRNREAAAEDARAKEAAAERRRVFEQEAAEQREAAAERGRLDRAADEEFRSRQRRDAEIQVQQSRQNVYAQCAQQCAMMESACLGYNPAADNVQACQRQGNDCRSTCGKDPGFLPKSFTAIQPHLRREECGIAVPTHARPTRPCREGLCLPYVWMTFGLRVTETTD